MYNIDILLTLKDVNNTGNDYYVVIEDKTNSRIHNNQLVKYIDKLITAKGVSQNRIFAVYYKTGHIAKTPDCITLEDNDKCVYKFDPNVKSERQEVESITNTYRNLAGMKISDLANIHKFFCSNPLISRCGCFSRCGGFILNEYAEYIDAKYNQYNSGVIDAQTGRTDRQWERIFDKAIERNESKYPDMLFKLAFTGSYWEIYVTKKPAVSGVQTCTDPILNVRSTIFEGETPKPKIYFFVYGRLTTNPPLKMHAKSATYIIPTENEKFYNGKLTSSNYQQPMISTKHIDDLLDAICEEYERVCNNGFKVAFSLCNRPSLSTPKSGEERDISSSM